ncbi:uncharacterized protein GLRG_06873 [Colletotrichum graminicola M1.001]|uniref:DUF6536 domain-containing protein n=1 Tax=Colletotrichum graminicola (strain M1.001 / M2 / FGSC 10212) TaxID=645133 RepID=E3QL46_COLGM|nr:uncharacterized protein GLRG_06873 [Colletotrichum graminicola M1.001]EFQ31584.1 hypothetical protein GLRG_06873 [Colletotrichum graminicola M1.001]
MLSNSENSTSRRRRLWEQLPSGWRRSATVNVVLLSISLLLPIGILAAAIFSTGDFWQAWMFYEAECKSSSVTATDTGLHLLLNAISTVILVSSNFFMQVLNAPSRKEVDDVHAKGDWLDICIPSWRNAFRLSWFKIICCLVLFLTSLPIHVVFNSIMSDYHLTIAAESFTTDASVFFLPGSGLQK